MINLDDKRYTPISIKEVTTPKEGYRVITDSWWAAINGMVFGFRLNFKGRHIGTPQCNKNRSIIERLDPDAEPLFIKVAYWPPYPQYCD
ncbi:MAG: hypothetical protein CV087_10740 [Candidatus Brocadia sp. WS118]|nr:MAG: hypothetical protein CV087_10740 [Candidatus Brocadia sp. WS118]